MTHESAARGLACSEFYTCIVELAKLSKCSHFRIIFPVSKSMVLVVAKMGRERIFSFPCVYYSLTKCRVLQHAS